MEVFPSSRQSGGADIWLWRGEQAGGMPDLDLLVFVSLAYLAICVASLGRPALVMGNYIFERAGAEGRKVPEGLRRRVLRTQISVVSTLCVLVLLLFTVLIF